eukprot:432590-Prymnesium_polylepis.1
MVANWRWRTACDERRLLVGIQPLGDVKYAADGASDAVRAVVQHGTRVALRQPVRDRHVDLETVSARPVGQQLRRQF